MQSRKVVIHSLNDRHGTHEYDPHINKLTHLPSFWMHVDTGVWFGTIVPHLMNVPILHVISHSEANTMKVAELAPSHAPSMTSAHPALSDVASQRVVEGGSGSD
ncbi:MAG: hypothetical protein JWQ22_477, partial [Devosia sp.]|nr:hypothetical protein [Devosia sp.]